MDLGSLEIIREIYKDFNPILQGGFYKCPYGLGFQWEFTPIEFNVWGSIRYLGLPFYPQFPVINFFLDFADPIHRIGIEVDSKAWHKDIRKDMWRQRIIESMGWKVVGFPSRLTYKEREDFEDDDGKVDMEKYTTESAEGILFKLYNDIGYFKKYG